MPICDRSLAHIKEGLESIRSPHHGPWLDIAAIPADSANRKIRTGDQAGCDIRAASAESTIPTYIKAAQLDS